MASKVFWVQTATTNTTSVDFSSTFHERSVVNLTVIFIINTEEAMCTGPCAELIYYAYHFS